MKIALVIDRFLPAKGGGERYVQILAQRLAERGHAVTILARRFPDNTPPKGIRYHRVGVPGWPGFLKVLRFARQCREEITGGDFDIVHDVGHTIGADIFNPHGGVEQVWLERYFASYNNAFHRAFKRIQRFLSPKERVTLSLQRQQYLSEETRRILAISPMIREHIRAYYPQIPSGKIALIENPAELSRFSPKNRKMYRAEERKRLNLSNGEIALLFVGNNFRLKGLHPLLRSLTVLGKMADNSHPFRLLVAGNESPKRWKRLADKLGVGRRVTFLGPSSEMERLYAASDIFVLPTFYDSAALVVLEALASGLPVITSRWNGTHTLIDVPAAGMVLEDNDNPEEIAKAIYRFFPEEIRAEALQQSPRLVASVGLDNHIDRILQLYDEVIKEKAHG